MAGMASRTAIQAICATALRVAKRLLACVALLSTALPPSVNAASSCTVTRVGELPITMQSLRPTLEVKINGREAHFIVDSGAFFSMISAATAAEYDLKVGPGPRGLRVIGIGGYANANVTYVDELSLLGVAIPKVPFLVGGSDVGYAGLLGQNVLGLFDVEYDLGKGAIRLFRSDGCNKVMMAYWLSPGQDHSEMPLERVDSRNAHTIGIAYVNGQKIHVAFDTGANTSVLSTRAAARAGVTINSPGVTDAGYSSGLGRGSTKAYIAPFASFKIGDGEEIKNTKLRIADIDLGFTDMLLGADFFISHRIFVANKEHKIFLSYNGGRVFDLSKGGATADVGSPPVGEEQSPDAVAEGTEDPAELARLGSALTTRREFAPAIAKLSRAVELAPDEPQYVFERGNAYQANGQNKLALADYDHAISLREDFLPAYVPRAQLHLAAGDQAAALADVDRAAQLAPAPSELRLTLAGLYERLDQLAAANEQYRLWLSNHQEDSRLVFALNQRSRNAALLDRDLPDALRESSRAVRIMDKRNPDNSTVYSYHGLIELRLGKNDAALDDFNRALKLSGKDAVALYGRAIVELKTGKTAQGETDLAAARQLAPKVGEDLTRYGVLPASP